MAGEYKVKVILDSRLDHFGTQYLVKWLGYPVFKAMWEPAKHLANALIFFISFYLAKDSDLSIRGSDVRVDVMLNNYLTYNIC